MLNSLAYNLQTCFLDLFPELKKVPVRNLSAGPCANSDALILFKYNGLSAILPSYAYAFFDVGLIV